MVAYYPPDRMGGVGEVVAHLHGALLAAGHDSRVVTAGSSRDDPRVERIATTPLGFVARLPRLAARAGGFDVVHCHHGDALGLLLALRLRRAKAPVLATFHVGHRGMGTAFRPYRLDGERFGTDARSWLYRHGTARLHRATDALVLRLADAASFVSRSAARDLLGPQRGAGARVVYNALPEPPPEGDEPEPEPAELLYVGAGGHRKRVQALPLVLARVREALPDARLRLVGVDPAREPGLRRRFAERVGEDAVRWEGVLPSAVVRRFYRAARVLVVPSAYEGLPMVILEALQAGLPCVATRVSGHPEVIEDGVQGFLVPVDDPTALAERCLDVLRDPALGRTLGEAGRAVVAERFGLARQRDAYLALYRDLCRARGRGA